MQHHQELIKYLTEEDKRFLREESGFIPEVKDKSSGKRKADADSSETNDSKKPKEGE